MDRRRSGLSRIMESYNDFMEKTRFLSDKSSFTVIFLNKGYSPVLELNNSAKTGLFLLKCLSRKTKIKSILK